MQRKFLYLLLALSVLCTASATWGQAKPAVPKQIVQNIAISRVNGIVIESSWHNPNDRSVHFMMRNKSKKDITAFHYQVIANHADGEITIEKNLWGDSFLFNPVDYARNKLFHSGGVFLPFASGSQREGGANYAWYAGDNITAVSVMVDLVAYADNTVEVANDAALQELVEERLRMAKDQAVIARIADDVLRSKVEHPVAAFVKALDEQPNRNGDVEEFNLQGLPGSTEEEKLERSKEVHEYAARLCMEASLLKVVTQ